MQPSRAFSLRLALTTSALQSTKVPWWPRVLGCPDDVDAEHLGAHPDLGRGEPDAARRDAHGGDEVGGELRRRRGRSGRPPSPGVTAPRPGRATRAAPGPRRQLGTRPGRSGSRLTSSSASAARRVDADTEVGGDAGSSRSSGHVGPGRQVDLGDEQVEVTGQAGGEVGDVAADAPRPPRRPRTTMPGRSPPCTRQHPRRRVPGLGALRGHLADRHGAGCRRR